MSATALPDGYDSTEAYRALLGFPRRALVPIGQGNLSYKIMIVQDPRRTDVDVLIVFPSRVTTPCFSEALDERQLPVTDLLFQTEVSRILTGRHGKLITRYLQPWELGHPYDQ